MLHARGHLIFAVLGALAFAGGGCEADVPPAETGSAPLRGATSGTDLPAGATGVPSGGDATGATTGTDTTAGGTSGALGVGGGSGVGTGRGSGGGVSAGTGLGASGTSGGTGNIPFTPPDGLSGIGGTTVGTGREGTGIPGGAGLGAAGAGGEAVGTNGPSGNSGSVVVFDAGAPAAEAIVVIR